MNKGKKYDAFISYKHDSYISGIAHTVLRKLEHYRPPKGSGIQKKKLYLCIDDQNFAAAGILNKQIQESLSNSEYLIYLACPETLGSTYCLDEIRYFKKLHDGRLDNVIVLLIKGEPKDVFPKELCYEGCWEPEGEPDSDRKTEIHWLDLRAKNFWEAREKLNESLLMLAAPLLHCEPDELIQRDRQWKKQKRLMWGMFGVTILTIALCVAYTFWLTWLMDYKRQAENAMANGDDNKALFYYAKTLSLNPVDEAARINAQILLQKEVWPMVVREDKDSIIFGNHVYPIDVSDQKEDFLWPVCTTTEGSYVLLWEEESNCYYYTGADETFVEELSGVGDFFYSGGQEIMDAWCFSAKEEPHYTFYWPEEKRMEKLEWEGNFQGEWNNVGVYALQPGRIVVGDFEALTFYQIENGICRELYRIGLDEIFHDDQSILEEYNISLMENYSFDIWPSPDGSRLVITANFWYNSWGGTICHSAAALLDTETYRLIASAESGECLISNVNFQADSQRLALIYNNENGVLENCGYVAVYDCSGSLVFQTECSNNVIPCGGYFCGEFFLLCDFSAVYFLDAETGERLCEPLRLHVNQAALTDDGQIALEHGSGVRYCRLIQYSESTTKENIEEEAILSAFQSEMEMKYQLADDLWLFTSDDRKEVILADENAMILDRFPIPKKGNENFVIALAYGISTQTAFALDEERDLYCIRIDMEQKKFADKEKVPVRGGVLGFAPAQNGVVYLDGYFPGHYYSTVSNLMYVTNDNFLFWHNPAVNFLGWIAEPDISDSYAGLISGESDYAVIVTQKEKQLDFRFFSMKTGDFLADMPLKATDDLFVCLARNDTIFIRSNGNWRSMWLGFRWANRDATQQLMDLSGYKLSGSRFKNNQILEDADAIMSPGSFGSWSKYLGWLDSVSFELEERQ